MLMGNQKDILAEGNKNQGLSTSTYTQHFQTLLKSIQLTNWKNHLTDSVKRYSLETYKLAQLGPKNIQKIYQKVSLKYKNNEGLRMNWYQNQLRLFIWFLAASPGVFGLSTNNYGHEELTKLALPFFGIHPDLCEYQFKSILSSQQTRAWQPEEDTLLSQTLKKHSLEGAWSSIAKQLFLQSDKKYFRTPQSCRERWQNHLDDRKVRGQWTSEQDLLLLKLILSQGKRWSIIAKKIGDTRTQHMVKNRFQTILRREFKSKKKPVRFSEEHQFCKDLVKKLSQKTTEELHDQNFLDNNGDACSPNASQSIQQDILSPNSSSKKSSSTPSLSETPKICTDQVIQSFSSTLNPSYLSFINLQEQQSEHQNNINPSNSPYFRNTGNDLGQYEQLSPSWISKSFFQKMQTQLQLQIPLFIDQTIFGIQQDEMIQYFYKEQREFE